MEYSQTDILPLGVKILCDLKFLTVSAYKRIVVNYDDITSLYIYVRTCIVIL